MSGITKTLLALGLLLVAVLGGFVYKLHRAQADPEIAALVYPTPKLLPEFSLTSHTGETFSRDQLLGQWSIVFFGYTFCPDICPTTMATLSAIMKDVPPDVANKVQVVFVSVDPERDTPERLAAYVPFYHPDFIGTTGTDEQLQVISMAVGAVYLKMPMGDDYQMQHTGRIFIIDPMARRFGIFADDNNVPGTLDANQIRQDIISIVRSY